MQSDLRGRLALIPELTKARGSPDGYGPFSVQTTRPETVGEATAFEWELTENYARGWG